jgi:hypothetical protein
MMACTDRMPVKNPMSCRLLPQEQQQQLLQQQLQQRPTIQPRPLDVRQ